MKGRNDLCFCGSGKKYKRCHLPVKGVHWREVTKKLREAEEAAAKLPKWFLK